MRTFSLSLFVIVAVFGIPRLVNEYRGVQPEAKAPPAMAANSAPIAAQSQPAAKPLPPAAPVPQAAIALAPVEQPAAVQLLPVTLRPSEIAPVPASQGPTPPKNEADLIASIQKELKRLGLYDGPSSGRWNKYVRYAVREFTRRQGGYVRDPKPTLELLGSLQAAGLEQAEAKRETKPDADTKPVRQAEFRPEEAPAKEAAPAQETTPNDDYLPPWMRRNASGAAAGASPAAANAAPSPVRTVARRVRHRRQRRSWDWDYGW